MLEAVRRVLAGEDAWVVGGAIRDELLGKPVVDLDVACRDPKAAAQAYGRLEEEPSSGSPDRTAPGG